MKFRPPLAGFSSAVKSIEPMQLPTTTDSLTEEVEFEPSVPRRWANRPRPRRGRNLAPIGILVSSAK
jgi:hypothetical protein